MAAKAYRLLRAVLWTAVKEDELLQRNPCRIPGADRETPEERPHLTLAQVARLMEAMPARRYRMLILLAAVASLRFGEITALRRLDVDLDNALIRVRQQSLEITGKGLVYGPPKSRAGIRDVAIPDEMVTLLREHLTEYVGEDPIDLVFTTPTGKPIRRGSFQKLVDWTKAVASIGVPGLHFHDLRHTGNMLAAGSKVTTRDLMARMGHDSMAAALIYQHASREADQAIAKYLGGKLSEITKPSDDDGDDGATGVLARAG